MHGGHRDDAEIQEASVWKRWVSAEAAAARWCYCSVGDVWTVTVTQSWHHGCHIFVWHKGMMTILFCKCSWTTAAVWNQSFISCGHFCYWFTPWGICGKLIEKIRPMPVCSVHFNLQYWHVLRVCIEQQLTDSEWSVSILTSDTKTIWIQHQSWTANNHASKAYSCDRYSGLTFVWFVLEHSDSTLSSSSKCNTSSHQIFMKGKACQTLFKEILIGLVRLMTCKLSEELWCRQVS